VRAPFSDSARGVLDAAFASLTREADRPPSPRPSYVRQAFDKVALGRVAFADRAKPNLEVLHSTSLVRE
jgi:hypothetical protein